MGTNRNIEQMERYLKETIRQVPLDEPGKDLLPDIMNKIETTGERSSLISVSAIINWKGWILILTIIVMIFGCLWIFGSEESLFTNIKIRNVLPDFQSLSELWTVIKQKFELSSSYIIMTSFLALLFYFIIQLIYLTKRYKLTLK